MRTEPIPVPMTTRLEHELARWRHAPRPARIEPPGPGQRSVWQFPRPPAVERVFERVTVDHGGVVIADTNACLRVCETASPPTYYIPRADIAMEHLVRVPGESLCEWKGAAAYYDVAVNDARSSQAAWRYPKVNDEYSMLEDHFGFYASRVDRCTVGGETVVPQPGGFYAGWITRELVGPWKGEPGTHGW